MDGPGHWIEADDGLARLFAALRRRGYDILGLTEVDNTIGLGPVSAPADLPRGRVMDCDGGRVSLRDGDPSRYFDKSLPMQGLKRAVYPAQETLCRIDADFNVVVPGTDAPKVAVIGARACDLAGLDVLETVFRDGPYVDERFAARRENLLIVAVDCAVPLETCFCASVDTGPHASSGFDLALTELTGDSGHGFVVRAGSDAGHDLLADLDARPAAAAEDAARLAQRDDAAAAMTRAMPAGAEATVKTNHDSPHWNDVAARCLSCANCTMVCPTCFCATVEDRNALDGTAWRERRWDSCFSIEFSYIHGGALRTSAPARYRQWITHKLGHWHDQFGTSGCVGCGRCIAWCPVGIDITAEVAALAADKPAGGPKPATANGGA